MEDCIFCKIVRGDLPSTAVYEDDLCRAIEDINPQAQTHILVMPKAHVSSLDEAQDERLLGHMMKVCAGIARDRGLAQNGYRVVSNVGEHGGQTVRHLHLHILGGQQLGDMG